jgi:hypothetical protein
MLLLRIGQNQFWFIMNFHLTGLDPTVVYQLICTFRSSATSIRYSNSVDSVIGFPSPYLPVWLQPLMLQVRRGLSESRAQMPILH